MAATSCTVNPPVVPKATHRTAKRSARIPCSAIAPAPVLLAIEVTASVIVKSAGHAIQG